MAGSLSGHAAWLSIWFGWSFKRSCTDELIASDRLLFSASSSNQLKHRGPAHKGRCSTPVTQAGWEKNPGSQFCSLHPGVWTAGPVSTASNVQNSPFPLGPCPHRKDSAPFLSSIHCEKQFCSCADDPVSEVMNSAL